MWSVTIGCAIITVILAIATLFYKIGKFQMEYANHLMYTNQRDNMENYDHWEATKKYMINYSIGVVARAAAVLVLAFGVEFLVFLFTSHPTNLSIWVQAKFYTILARVSQVSQNLGISTATNTEFNKFNLVP